jgi:xylulose-5-phosphate/fructose-6-phosphate phosphoketolase
MPGEEIDKPNPEALPSHLPEMLDQLMVKLDLISLEQSACDALVKFRRAACYIAAGNSPIHQLWKSRTF